MTCLFHLQRDLQRDLRRDMKVELRVSEARVGHSSHLWCLFLRKDANVMSLSWCINPVAVFHHKWWSHSLKHEGHLNCITAVHSKTLAFTRVKNSLERMPRSTCRLESPKDIHSTIYFNVMVKVVERLIGWEIRICDRITLANEQHSNRVIIFIQVSEGHPEHDNHQRRLCTVLTHICILLTMNGLQRIVK